MARQFTLGERERLKSRKQIDALFKSGKKINHTPFLVYYSLTSNSTEPLRFGVGVSSKVFRKAVDRNRVKRLVREAYRLQKNSLQQKLRQQNKGMAVFFIYTAKELQAYKILHTKMEALLKKLITVSGKTD